MDVTKLILNLHLCVILRMMLAPQTMDDIVASGPHADVLAGPAAALAGSAK
jgi:hypothetical protein